MPSFFKIATIISLFISFLLTQDVQGQNVPIGTWQSYLSYKNGKTLAVVDQEVWVGTQSSYLMAYDLEDASLTRLNNLQGFAESEVAVIRHNPDKNWTLVAYDNANIDFISEDKFLNIPDIKNTILPGDKSIYEIHFIDDLAYLATGFGIVVLNLEREEIKDTYYIGVGGEPLQVFDITSNETHLMAATAEGVFYAELSNPNLSNFNNWQVYEESDGLPIKSMSNIHNDGTKILTATKGTLYELDEANNTWNFLYDANENQNVEEGTWEIVGVTGNSSELVLCEAFIVVSEETGRSVRGGQVILLDQANNETIVYDGANLQRPQEAAIDNQDRIWIADNFVGLVEINANGEQQYPRRPIEPRSNRIWALEVDGEGFWVAPARLTSGWSGNSDFTGAYFYENGKWENFISENGAKDILDVAIHPNGNTTYLASYENGLIELKTTDGTTTETLYDSSNSSIQKTEGDVRHRVSGMAFDKQNNLWISNYGAPEPISVFTTDGEWQSYLPVRNNGTNYSLNPVERANKGFTEIVVDNFNNKWFVVRNVGVMVSTCQDPLNCGPGDYRLFKHIDFRNGIPTNDVNCLVQDLEDEIWVGTDDGLAVFFCTSNPLNDNCEFSKPIIPVTEDEGAYLLTGVRVNTIAVDPADRKWIGTDQGIQVLSSDGKESIQTFNIDNSPLISNIIRDIVINGQTGEVIIGTDKGVMSYRAEATSTNFVQPEEVLVYPNPVRENYEGPIAIKGLARGAIIKITDVSGNLVFETEALGGQAIWDGRDYLGQRARTGVYLVLSSNEDGTQTIATKFFLVGK